MAGYSIFSDTIADMTWPAVEEAAARHLPILVPVAVIEQHGHHLPLATDTYGAHLLCSLVKSELEELGFGSVIAPPYYFGLNVTTGMFPGSLNVRAETMIGLLTDILENYSVWGFDRQLIINHHGDPQHNRAIVQAIKALRAQDVRRLMSWEASCRSSSTPSTKLPSTSLYLYMETRSSERPTRKRLSPPGNASPSPDCRSTCTPASARRA